MKRVLLAMLSLVLFTPRPGLAGPFGYINLNVPNGLSLWTAHLAGIPATVSGQLVNVVSGMSVFKMGAQGFEANNYLGGWDNPNMPLLPGEAWFVQNPAPTVLVETIVGEVVDGTNRLPAGLSACGLIMPQSGRLQQDFHFPAAAGDKVYLFDEGSQSFSPVLFDGSTWSPAEPTLAVGKGFLVKKAAATNWVYIFGDPVTNHVTFSPPALAKQTPQINFFTYATNPAAGRVYAQGEGTPLGSAYRGQLYAGTNADESLLVPLGAPAAFGDGARAGYISAGTVDVPFLAAGGPLVFVQLRAWAAAAGATYEQARANGGASRKSAVFVLRPSAVLENGQPGLPPPSANQFPSFALAVTPELKVLAQTAASALVGGRGAPATQYQLQSADDPVAPLWTARDLQWSSTNGVVSFSDASAPTPFRMYRIVEP